MDSAAVPKRDSRKAPVRTSMESVSTCFVRPAKTVSLLVAAMLSISSGAAGAACTLCDTEVVMNQELASCFLDQFDKFAGEKGSTIMVDLSECAESRGIVEGLPTVGGGGEEPNTEFIVSRSQLD